jgi:hypothetical protein
MKKPKHQIIVGKAGSGKTANLILPLVLNDIGASNNYMLTGMKGEVFSSTLELWADFLPKAKVTIDFSTIASTKIGKK